MARKYSLQKGRTYIHSRCGEATCVSGNDFAGLCNPFAPCLGTVCAACGGPDSVGKFSWADTGESLSEYRKRLRRKSPVFFRLWAWLFSPLIGAGGGAAVAVPLFNKNLLADAAIGAGIGALAMFLFIGPKILGLIAGDRFYKSR